MSSRLIWSFTESLVNLFLDCIVLKSKAGCVTTYFSCLSFRGFVDICSWFICVLRSCCLNGQVLYITFGSTYVGLYHCVLGELVTIVIVICIVRKGYNLFSLWLLGHRVPVRLNGFLGEKSGIREGRPRESTKSCLCRVFLMDVSCTTCISRRLRDM